MKGFFDQYTTTGDPTLRAWSGDLLDRYRAYAAANNIKAMNGNEFAEELDRRGFAKKKINGKPVRYGVALKDDKGSG